VLGHLHCSHVLDRAISVPIGSPSPPASATGCSLRPCVRSPGVGPSSSNLSSVAKNEHPSGRFGPNALRGNRLCGVARIEHHVDFCQRFFGHSVTVPLDATGIRQSGDSPPFRPCGDFFCRVAAPATLNARPPPTLLPENSDRPPAAPWSLTQDIIRRACARPNLSAGQAGQAACHEAITTTRPVRLILLNSSLPPPYRVPQGRRLQ